MRLRMLRLIYKRHWHTGIIKLETVEGGGWVSSSGRIPSARPQPPRNTSPCNYNDANQNRTGN